MRTHIPILSWVMSEPTTHCIGTAQESNVIKWKWYVSERAKPGEKGVSVLHEQIAEAPEEGGSSQWAELKAVHRVNYTSWGD